VNKLLRFLDQPTFDNPSLIVCCQEDAGKLAHEVAGHLNRKMSATTFCEIDPVAFFSLGGVAIEDDVAQFPLSRFCSGDRNDIVVFQSSEPSFERYRFLSAVLDVARDHCGAKELYTVGGTVSAISHTDPRRILAVFNQQKFPNELQDYGLEQMNWEGPPAISSYLLWMAERRGVPGVGLWAQIPFYLAACRDLRAIRQTLAFLSRRLSLELDLAGLDERIRIQDVSLTQLRQEDGDVNRYITTLESGLSLGTEEQIELTQKVSEVLENEH
jgi:proteasome assembly chaperone (PAC2) family protein